ncbi:MAG: carbon monoxide dehydrogenase [Lachnospiraceae bacterium]|nr:carbon monoxide dehydrogenase [Lachnospiraceae bacterium]
MELYNKIISGTEELLKNVSHTDYAYDPGKVWPVTKDFELVMAREGAYELGGSGLPAVCYSCVTSSSHAVDSDGVCVYGPGLDRLKKDSPYARIALLRVGDIESDDENDTDEAFRAIQEIDFVRYRVYPKGFMIRTSSETGREQVRIASAALKEGLSFEKLGNLFISNYKKDPNVLNARILFITDPGVDYAKLASLAKTVHDITMSLSQILKGLPTDCGSCNLKDICDEVEGMRELHFSSSSVPKR